MKVRTPEPWDPRVYKPEAQEPRSPGTPEPRSPGALEPRSPRPESWASAAPSPPRWQLNATGRLSRRRGAMSTNGNVKIKDEGEKINIFNKGGGGWGGELVLYIHSKVLFVCKP